MVKASAGWQKRNISKVRTTFIEVPNSMPIEL
jgi:hypothetical protein